MTEAVNTGPQPIDHNKGKQYRCHSRKINQKQDHSTRSHFVISGRLGEAGRSEFAMKLKKRREESCKRSFHEELTVSGFHPLKSFGFYENN